MFNAMENNMTQVISPVRDSFMSFMSPKAPEYKAIIESGSNGRRLPGNIWGYLMLTNTDLEKVWKEVLAELPNLMDPAFDNTPVWGKAGYLLKKKVFADQALVNSVIRQVMHDSTGKFHDSKIVDAFLKNIQTLNDNSVKKIKVAVKQAFKHVPKKLAIVFAIRFIIHLVMKVFH
jgi:hypothetical protein